MTRSHPLHVRTALTLTMAMLATLAAPASATPVTPAPAPAPPPAPSGSVAGPPDGLIAPPPANTRPLPTPQIIVPAPTPSPTPRAIQSPQVTPAPAPRPANRTPAPTVPTAAPAAPATEPLLPELQPSPQPGMSEETSTPPVTDTVPTPPPPTPADNPIPEWLPLAAIAAAVALLGGAWIWWRRRKRPLALPAPEPEVGSAPPPKPAAPKAAPRPAAPATQPAAATPLGRRADLSVAFEALSAQSTLLNLRIRYAVIVRNSGTLDAAPVTVRIGLFAGSHVNPQGIAQWFNLDDQALHHAVDRVAAGGDYRFEGELAAPLDALNPITVDGRVLAIPLVAIDARYNHPAGEAPIDGQAARAFVIGREPSREGAKLAPFRLDQGPTSFAPLGQRDTGISKVA